MLQRDEHLALVAGTVLEGRYALQSTLGRGGFATTYLASDNRVPGRKVAIKEYLPSQVARVGSDGLVTAYRGRSGGDAAAEFGRGKQQFLSEAAALAAIEHAHVVRVSDRFEAYGTAYLVLDYIAGPTLEEALLGQDQAHRETTKPKPASAAWVKAFARQLLKALVATHAAGVLHRDIKPANLILRVAKGAAGVAEVKLAPLVAPPDAVLIDFGAARADLMSRTLGSSAVVSDGYSAPEQYNDGRGGVSSKPASDLYALGATLYHLVTGHVPITSTARQFEVSEEGKDPLPAAVDVAAGNYPAAFLILIDQLMALRIKDRPVSAADALAELNHMDRDAATPRDVAEPTRPVAEAERFAPAAASAKPAPQAPPQQSKPASSSPPPSSPLPSSPASQQAGPSDNTKSKWWIAAALTLPLLSWGIWQSNKKPVTSVQTQVPTVATPALPSRTPEEPATDAASMGMGLGGIEVKSGLNEPLLAEIQVIQSVPGEVDGLVVALASDEEFARVGIDRASLDLPLNFSVGTSRSGQAVIKVTSTTPVKEPLLNLLLEVNSSKGRLLREYTVLFDPPARGSSEVTSAASWQPGEVVRDRLKDGSEGPQMVVLPAGQFTMGSNDGADDEKPPHTRNIPSMALGKFEVTRGEFAAFVAAKPSFKTEAEQGDGCYGLKGTGWEKDSAFSWRDAGFQPYDDDHPVVCVSWNDAQAYVAWLREATGKRYRLPSEAEQEYAIRAVTTIGDSPRFVWGDDENAECGAANGADATLKAALPSWTYPTSTCADHYVYTAPVGSFRANAFGLHDTVGNVLEWGQDCWIGDYKSVASDHAARETGSTAQSRVLRGGGWGNGPVGLRSAFRDHNSPNYRGSDLGFRLAQDR